MDILDFCNEHKLDLVLRYNPRANNFLCAFGEMVTHAVAGGDVAVYHVHTEDGKHRLAFSSSHARPETAIREFAGIVSGKKLVFVYKDHKGVERFRAVYHIPQLSYPATA